MAAFPRSIRPLSLLLLACVAACRTQPGGGEAPGPGATPDSGGGPPPPAPVSAPGAAGNGLSAADREAFYHLAEGSEVAPLNLVRALRSTVTQRPFFERPERFGLIADPANVDGLPVGATGDYTVDTRFLNLRMLGFNCSACHVTEVTWQGNRVRVDGAPSRFYPDSLTGELKKAIKHTVSDPFAFLQYLKDLRAIERSRPPAVAAREPAQLRPANAPLGDALLAQMTDADTTPVEREFMVEMRRVMAEDSARSPAVNLFNVPWDSTAPANRALRERYRDGGARAAVARALGRLRPRARAQLMAQAGAPTAAQQAAATESMRDWVIALRLLRDRLATLVQQAPRVPTTADGIGRVDAFDVARNKIYPHSPVPTTAPVSFPFLWGFAETGWLHYDANTNSVMERNLGQALGVGAIWDRRTLQSTLNPRNIYQLELLARKIEAPAWPASFPPVDAAKAAQGRPLFTQYCAGCHQDQSADDVCYSLASMGTDSLRPINFALPLGRGRFTDSVAGVLHGLKRQAYATFRVPPDSQRIMDGLPDARVVWRTTRSWGVRPLAGVWATAPYLHNGSVPNLYELLLPPNRRSARFMLGQTEYDPVRVGFSAAVQGVWTFDTTLPGNGNGGHEYGTQLGDPERMALVEYLKTLGSHGPSTPPVGGGGGMRCPSLQWQASAARPGGAPTGR